MKDKLKKWTIDNISNLKLSAVSQLLRLLKDEEYSELPLCASTSLGFSHSIDTRPMISKQNTIGDYIYLGIKNGLKNVITDIY